MHILMTYTSYPLDYNDWRGRFIFDMASALAARGDVKLNLWGPPGIKPSGSNYIANNRESVWLQSLVENGGIAHSLRKANLAALYNSLKLLNGLFHAYRRENTADVIHVNWLPNALPLLFSNTPALITVLGADYKLLSFPGLKSALRYVIKKRKCIIAPNAEWMVTELNRIFGDIAEIRPILFGVHPEWFKVNRNFHNTKPRRWLVILRLTPQKIGSLFKWGENIFQNNDELHLFGPLQEKLSIPYWVHYHGTTHPEDLRQNWFPDAYGVITLSQHDEGRPQILLDAMASGLPVITSAIPAHTNLVVQNVTGYIVKTKQEFSSAVTSLSDIPRNIDMGKSAKEWIRYSIGTWQDCASRYVSAYETLLD